MKRRRPPRRRSIPLNAEIADLLKDQIARFREKFGRDPGPDDPLLFDPDAHEPRPMDAAKIVAAMAEAMEQAGIDPAKIYAFRRTGLVVTEDNARFLTPEDLAEWRAAIEEYKTRT